MIAWASNCTTTFIACKIVKPNSRKYADVKSAFVVHDQDRAVLQKLDAERLPAAALILGVGVVDFEALSHQTIVIVEFGPSQI